MPEDKIYEEIKWMENMIKKRNNKKRSYDPTFKWEDNDDVTSESNDNKKQILVEEKRLNAGKLAFND